MASPRTLRVEEPGLLLAFLQKAFKDQKRTRLKHYLKFRCVTVNGRVATRHDHPLAPGDEVAVELEKRKPVKGILTSGVRILYEDDAAIVIHKPPGMLSVSTEGTRSGTAYHEVGAYLSAKSGGRPRRAHVVHRIDKHTSGLLLFAKSTQARAFFLDHWKQVDKRYLAIVEGVPARNSGTLQSHLREDEDMKVYSAEEAEDTELAITHYRVLKSDGNYALVECRLETGRKNQIRVQMAEIGHPIAGDVKYGSCRNPCGRLALHAWRLRFPHPATRKIIEVESAFPEALARVLQPD